MEKLIEELKKIVAIEGTTEKNGTAARLAALEVFIRDHIQDITVENHIIKANLTSEEEDFLKYHMGYQIAEKLIDESAMVRSSDNKIRVSVLVMGNRFPRNE